jgi:hypothetical protein
MDSDSPIADEPDMIEIKEMTIDQLAGAVVLFLGAVGSLLLVIWQSRCACKCRIGCSDKCYIFDCSREPPPADPKKAKDKDKDKDKDKEEEKADEETPSLTPNSMGRKN